MFPFLSPPHPIFNSCQHLLAAPLSAGEKGGQAAPFGVRRALWHECFCCSCRALWRLPRNAAIALAPQSACRFPRVTGSCHFLWCHSARAAALVPQFRARSSFAAAIMSQSSGFTSCAAIIASLSEGPCTRVTAFGLDLMRRHGFCGAVLRRNVGCVVCRGNACAFWRPLLPFGQCGLQ